MPKHRTVHQTSSSSMKRAQLVAARRALEYTTNPCTKIVVYEGADKLQMLLSEHVLITRLWMCHMIQYLYPRFAESQIDHILMRLNAKRSDLIGHLERSVCLTFADNPVTTPALHEMVSCIPPALCEPPAS